jgi:hypothetical protein
MHDMILLRTHARTIVIDIYVPMPEKVRSILIL